MRRLGEFLMVIGASLSLAAEVGCLRPPGKGTDSVGLGLLAIGGVLVLVSRAAQQNDALLREKEERIRQRHPERKDIREAALNEMECPHCKAVVNPVTGDGLHSPEAEPWLLICSQCQGTIEPDV